MAVWTEYIGIFDYSCGTFSSPSYNPDNIDVSGKTFGTHYIILDIANEQDQNNFDVAIKKLPKRLNMPMGMGKVDLTITLNGYVLRRTSGANKGSAISKYNLLRRFVETHDEMSDDDVYLVMRERNADDNGWDYAEFEDITSPTHNYNVKFLKGKCGTIVKKYATYGQIDYQIQFLEGWY